MAPSTHETPEVGGQTPRRSHTAADEDGETEFERAALATGTILAGKYRIEGRIGEGGMGDVYRAHHLKIDKPVAIKVLAPEQVRRPRLVTRFLQEARAASRIRHENVVDITDFGESEGLTFFVMELLDGEDLSRLLKREERIGWARAKGIVLQLLDALAAAHRAGVIHRDIKPHNCVIIRRESRADFVKVIDFGIAKLRNDGSGEQLTRTGAIVGTAEYMSPEQGSGAELDGRCDLYSVGVILYRMLTGRVPFAGSNPMGVLYQHIHTPLTPPSKACPEAGIGPELDALVARALEKDRERRFADAAAFAAAVRAIGDDGGTRPVRRSDRSLWIGGAAALGVAMIAWAVAPGGDAPSETVAPPVVATAPAEPPRAAAIVSAPTEPPVPAPAPIVEAAPEAAPEPTSTLPPTRSRKAIANALRRAEDAVRRCGKQAGLFPGETVTVAFVIQPSGRIAKVDVRGAFAASGTRCIADAVASARLGPAAREQRATHTFAL